ncbi:MAG: ABC transporter permease [Candidatus Acidiferrales bacterium]
MDRLMRDVRGGLRRLTKNPGFTAVVVLTHALGIGVTTAVFSIFNSVLLAPLPYPEPHEIVSVYDTQPACSTCPASFPKYHDWRERNHVFEAIGGSTEAEFVMTGSGDPVRLTGMYTTASLVDVFGVRPMMGRWYTLEEDQFGGPKVVVLSHGLWMQRFNGDRNILGRKLLFSDEPYEVIGVMPEGFTHHRAEFFVPLQRKLDPATRGSHFLATYARLKDGIALERAIADMRALGQTLAAEFGHNHGIDIRSYREVWVGSVRAPLNVLLGAVFFILLIGCANVANLLLSSSVARRTELAIRMALGAGRKELARQLTTESVVLALVGGVGGVLLAYWAVDTFVWLAGDQLPRASTVQIDAAVLAFAAVVSLGVGVFCSVWPIVLLGRQDLAAAVREGDTRTAAGAGKKIGGGLVVAEIAVAFALVVSAGLLVKNLLLLQSRDAGIRTDRIVAFDVSPPANRYSSTEAVTGFYRELHSRLSQVAGVEGVGMASHLPMYRYGTNGEFQIEGGTPWEAKDAPLVEYRWMHGDYLQTLGVPLLSGRMLDQRDGAGTRTVLINQAMAEKFWPGKDPLGRRFGQGSDTSRWYEVVGVIGDIRSYGLADSRPYEFFRTVEQTVSRAIEQISQASGGDAAAAAQRRQLAISWLGALTVVVRTRGENPVDVIPSARQIVASLDPAMPISAVQTMEQVVADSVGQPRLMSALTGLFGALGGLLAMVGVYSVMGYNVRRQRREFGIRLAIGANQGDVVKMVVGRGLLLATLGVAIGAAGAWMLSSVLTAMLHDVKPTDPLVFAGTAAAVLLVALLASYVPARAAGRVDPTIVLRES